MYVYVSFHLSTGLFFQLPSYLRIYLSTCHLISTFPSLAHHTNLPPFSSFLITSTHVLSSSPKPVLFPSSQPGQNTRREDVLFLSRDYCLYRQEVLAHIWDINFLCLSILPLTLALSSSLFSSCSSSSLSSFSSTSLPPRSLTTHPTSQLWRDGISCLEFLLWPISCFNGLQVFPFVNFFFLF